MKTFKNMYERENAGEIFLKGEREGGKERERETERQREGGRLGGPDLLHCSVLVSLVLLPPLSSSLNENSQSGHKRS